MARGAPSSSGGNLVLRYGGSLVLRCDCMIKKSVLVDNSVVAFLYLFHREIGTVLLPSDSPLLQWFYVEICRNSGDYLPQAVNFVSSSLTVQGCY